MIMISAIAYTRGIHVFFGGNKELVYLIFNLCTLFTHMYISGKKNNDLITTSPEIMASKVNYHQMTFI